MKLNLEELKKYLDKHPQHYQDEGITGLIDVLFWDYAECNRVTNDTIRDKAREARWYMHKLTDEEIDNVFHCFYLMCTEYQRLFFTAGVQVGARLMTELMKA